MKNLSVTLLLVACFTLFAQVSITNAQSQAKTADSGSTKKMEPASQAPQMSRAFANGNNVPSTGVALEGYCPVCYIAANKAAKGSPEFSHDHGGVTYWFVSAEVRDTFIASPETYVPAYGGWCAVGVALNQRFPVDPTNFKVVNGRIMLFLKNETVDGLEIWNQNEAVNLRKADANWTNLRG